MTTPRYSSGTSIATRSTGSCSAPFTVRVTTCGLPTVSSNPSRRIVSTRIASWSSPRPCTSQTSGAVALEDADRDVADDLPVEPGFTRRAVTFLPSRPASGEVLMPIVIESVGSSTRVTGSGRGVVGIGERLADRDLVDARDRDDVARPASSASTRSRPTEHVAAR